MTKGWSSTGCIRSQKINHHEKLQKMNHPKFPQVTGKKLSLSMAKRRLILFAAAEHHGDGWNVLSLMSVGGQLSVRARERAGFLSAIEWRR